MNNNHKFVPICNGTGTYDFAFGCEYCGMIAFYANNSESVKNSNKSKALCPNAPQNEKTTDES